MVNHPNRSARSKTFYVAEGEHHDGGRPYLYWECWESEAEAARQAYKMNGATRPLARNFKVRAATSDEVAQWRRQQKMLRSDYLRR